MKISLGILGSHRGSHLHTVLDAIADQRLAGTEVVAAISNNADAVVLQTAAAAGVPTFHLSGVTHPAAGELDAAICSTLQARQANVVLLLGYLKLLGPLTPGGFSGRIVNIHPSLLPRHGGKGMYGRHVHERVLASGDSEAGATLHVVDEVYDHGRIIAQRKVAVQVDDTVDALAERVVSAERLLLVEFLQALEGERTKLPLS